MIISEYDEKLEELQERIDKLEKNIGKLEFKSWCWGITLNVKKFGVIGAMPAIFEKDNVRKVLKSYGQNLDIDFYRILITEDQIVILTENGNIVFNKDTENFEDIYDRLFYLTYIDNLGLEYKKIKNNMENWILMYSENKE